MLDHQELLEETVASLDNLPAEVRHIFNELRTRSEDYYEIRANIAHKDVELKKLIKNGPIEPPPPADSVPAGTTGTNNENNKSKEDQPEGVGAPLPSTDKPAIAPDGNTPLAPSTSTQANSIDNAANETTASTTAAVVAAPGAASDLTTPQQPQPSPNSTTGLDWKTGAEAVEDFPEQKEAFWKIVQMFGDCGRIADEKIALVDRAKTVLDRHIKRITASLEANGVLLPNTSSSSTAATPLPVPQHVPLSSSSSSLSSSLAHSSSTLHQSIPPPPNVRSTSQAFLFSTPLNPQAPKFLSQRTPSSSTDILNKASEMAAAVVAESNSKLSSLGAGISGIGNSGSNSLAHDGGTPSHNKSNPLKRPLSSAFTPGGMLLTPGNAGPGLGNLHPLGGVGASSGLSGIGSYPAVPSGGAVGYPAQTPLGHQHPLAASMTNTGFGLSGGGFTPNKKRLKRKLFDESGSGIKQQLHASSSQGLAGGGASADADEDVYCICQAVSYGEMIGCDNPNCDKEWFHLDCVGLKAPPEGVWLCPECVAAKESQSSSMLDDDDLDADDGVVKKSVFATVAAAAHKRGGRKNPIVRKK